MNAGSSSTDPENNRPNPARTRTIYHEGGLEGKLDAAAWIQLALALLCALGLLAFTGGRGMVAVILVAFNGWFAWLALRAIAEIIRLQKKANGLPYGGRISEATEVVIENCSTCGAILYNDDRCEKCGIKTDIES